MAERASAKGGGDPYDVVVVGAGLAGLTAGALLAHSGRRVLVVESQDRVGGYARSLISDGYRFDPAVHLVMGGGTGPMPGLITEVLDVLGVADRCELVAVDPFYEARFPDMTVRVGAGTEAFLDAHLIHFPSEANGLRRLVDLGEQIYDELVRFPVEPRTSDLLTAPMRCPRLTRYRNRTVAEVTDRHLRDPRLRALYMALFPYVGLPPSLESFPVWSAMMASYLREGAFYCRGGFQQLADAFAAGLDAHGGELIVGQPVRRIHLDDSGVSSVELDNGRRLETREVIATGDVRDTVSTLIGEKHLPGRYLKRLRHFDLSASVLEMYLGTDLDLAALDLAQETIVHPSWDLDATWHAARGGAGNSVMITIPTLTDPSLAPAGSHQVVVAGIAPDPNTRPNLERIASEYLRAATTVIPGISDNLVHITAPNGDATDTMPPPLHRIDTIYGWATTPRQSLLARLPQQTPIPGLTLAGQWTQPGHGIWTVIGSGVRAARLTLDRDTDLGLSPAVP